MRLTGFWLAAGMTILSCTSVEASDPKETPAGEFALSPEQIKDYRQSALNGNARLAARLADYYEYWSSDSINAEFWARLAAEHGGCEELVRYRPYLKQLPHLNSPERQREWRERKEKACTAESNPGPER